MNDNEDTVVFRNVGVSRKERRKIPFKTRIFRSTAGRDSNLASYMNLLRDIKHQECDVHANFPKYSSVLPVPVAARSKACVFGRSPAEIVGSNPTGGMDVCLL